MNVSPQMAIADVLLEHDDLPLEQIIAHSEVPLTRQQAGQILLDAVRRRHVIRSERKYSEPSYSLTLLGRSAAPIICSAKAFLRYQRTRAMGPSPRAAATAGSTVPRSDYVATMPKHLLRALVIAAKDSGKELQGELREAVETALREVAW